MHARFQLFQFSNPIEYSVRSHDFTVGAESAVIVTGYGFEKGNNAGNGAPTNCPAQAFLTKTWTYQTLVNPEEDKCTCIHKSSGVEIKNERRYEQQMRRCGCAVRVDVNNPVLIIATRGRYFFTLSDPTTVGNVILTVEEIPLSQAIASGVSNRS